MCSCPPLPSRQCAHRTLLRPYVWRLTLNHAAVSGLDRHRHYSSRHRAFPVAAAWAWNALPSSVRTSSTYLAFRRQLKALLFKASFEHRTWLRYLFVAQRWLQFWHNVLYSASAAFFWDSVTIILTFIIIMIIIIIIRVTTSDEGLKHMCVDLSDYNRVSEWVSV